MRETLPTDEVLVDALDRAGPLGIAFRELQTASGLPEDALRAVLAELRESQRAAVGRGAVWYSMAAIEEMRSLVVAALSELHAGTPLRTFAEHNVLVARAAPSRDVRECFRLALDDLVQQGSVVLHGERVRLAGREPRWAGRLADARERILAICLDSGLAVPRPEELGAAAGLAEREWRRVLDALVDADELRLLVAGIYVHRQVYDECRERVRAFLEQHGRITVGQCRELLGASRKYLLPFLEALDQDGLTVRMQSHRELRRRPS